MSEDDEVAFVGQVTKSTGEESSKVVQCGLRTTRQRRQFCAVCFPEETQPVAEKKDVSE